MTQKLSLRIFFKFRLPALPIIQFYLIIANFHQSAKGMKQKGRKKEIRNSGFSRLKTTRIKITFHPSSDVRKIKIYSATKSIFLIRFSSDGLMQERVLICFLETLTNRFLIYPPSKWNSAMQCLVYVNKYSEGPPSEPQLFSNSFWHKQINNFWGDLKRFSRFLLAVGEFLLSPVSRQNVTIIYG